VIYGCLELHRPVLPPENHRIFETKMVTITVTYGWSLAMLGGWKGLTQWQNFNKTAFCFNINMHGMSH
jgi:hypothetical protein